MELIDRDKLLKDVENDLMLNEKSCSECIDHIRTLIDDQPQVFPMFSGRTKGKTAFKNYIGMCEVLDNYGIDSTSPVESLDFVLRQYQKIICESTGCRMSKLTYDADIVIATINDRINELDREEVVSERINELKDLLSTCEATLRYLLDVGTESSDVRFSINNFIRTIQDTCK